MAENAFYLGLKPNEFYSMLPKHFYKFCEARYKYLENKEYADNMRNANILCMLANINRDKKKKPTPFKPIDFMPKKEKKVMDVDAMAKMLKGFTKAYGGDVVG